MRAYLTKMNPKFKWFVIYTWEIFGFMLMLYMSATEGTTFPSWIIYISFTIIISAMVVRTSLIERQAQDG